VIDYIQLLQGSGKRGNDNRVQEVTEDHDQPEGAGGKNSTFP